MSKKAHSLQKLQIDQVVSDLERVFADPAAQKKAEQTHKKVSSLSPEDLFRQYNV